MQWQFFLFILYNLIPVKFTKWTHFPSIQFWSKHYVVSTSQNALSCSSSFSAMKWLPLISFLLHTWCLTYRMLNPWSTLTDGGLLLHEVLSQQSQRFRFYSFDSLQFAVLFVWNSQHLRCWRLLLLRLLWAFSWKYIWCSQDHNE